MPSIEKLTRGQLENALVRARTRADAAEAKARAIPADVEFLQKELASMKKRARRADGVVDLAVAAAVNAIGEQDFQMKLPPPVNFVRAKEECKALLHLTDTQIGKHTASYSTEIARERIMEVVRKSASCCQGHNRARGIRELHLFLGGDMVENEIIFAHQPHEIDSNVLVQAMSSVPTILRDAIMYLRSYFETIRVYCVPGNHGRPGQFGGGAHPNTNWDTAAYMMTREMVARACEVNPMKGHKVEFNIAADWKIVDTELFDHYPLLVHGDKGIRGGYGGFPFYGVGKAVSKWSVSIPEPWKALYFGHFHQWASGSMFRRQWFCGSTLESGNEYARAEFDASGRPQQRLQLWTPKQLICDLPIYANYKFREMGFAAPAKERM